MLGPHPEGDEMEKEFLNPDTIASFPKMFTQVVKTTAGGVTTIHVSGQVAIDPDGQLVGKGDYGAQAERAYENLRLALEAAGAAPSDVVKMNTYVVDLKPELSRAIGMARAKFLDAPIPPASTMVGVTSLVLPDFLIEAEAVAIIEA
jgi:enamine deaminase RidA (YjgF/YER057c/UK114 family)